MTTLFVEEDPLTGDLYLKFPDELMEEVGWNIGDTIEWIPNDDGSWALRKKDDVLAEKEENSN